MWQVVGNSRAVSLLQRGLAEGSLAHAYLLSGPRQVGKMKLALELARAVNCEASETPCGVCRSCERIASGKHADVQVIGFIQGERDDRLRREIGIDQIREMQKQVSLPPFEGRCKVFIIDGAEALTSEAANSLLKTLEEPVGRVLFILLTQDGGLLPETVVSRCQEVRLAPLSAYEVEAFLGNSLGVESSKAKLLACLAQGRIGWAVNAARDESLLTERKEVLAEALSLISANFDSRFKRAGELALEFGREPTKTRERLGLWCELFRDLLLVRLGSESEITNIDLREKLRNLAETLEPGELRDFLGCLRQAETQLRLNASPRLVFEVLMLKLPRRKGV
ncbi:MAG: DNA polymerase III subunit delta' [Chloroflexota bacterium]